MPESSLPPPFPEVEYRTRRQALIELMGAAGIDVGIVLAPADLIYFTGYDLASQLILDQDVRKRGGERDGEVDLALTALVARENLLLVGAPGSAKSLLLDSLMHWMRGRKFSILLNRFTTPEAVVIVAWVAPFQAGSDRTAGTFFGQGGSAPYGEVVVPPPVMPIPPGYVPPDPTPTILDCSGPTGDR